MVTANKRREKDVMKLLVSEYEVTLINENTNSEFIVKFFGPKESPYEGVSVVFTFIPDDELTYNSSLMPVTFGFPNNQFPFAFSLTLLF